MTYIQEFEAELAKKLNSNEGTDSLVRWISEKVLESYRNGITAGNKGVQVKRKGASRPMGALFRLQNHEYERIRASWREARKALKYEYKLLRRLERASDLNAELSAIDDQSYDDDDPALRNLDLGVASVVLTLGKSVA